MFIYVYMYICGCIKHIVVGKVWAIHILLQRINN